MIKKQALKKRNKTLEKYYLQTEINDKLNKYKNEKSEISDHN